MEKTYRDFVREVITEISNRVQFKSKFHKELMKKDDKEDRIDYKSIMKIYADSFLLIYGEETFINFIESIISKKEGEEKEETIQFTKYQIMQAFFKYYFDVVGNVRECLKQASENIEIDEKDYSKKTIRKIQKIINKGQQNKKLFVSLFNSLTRSW